MSSRSAIAWFVIKLVGIFAILVAPWPGWRETCSESVAATMQYLTCDLWGGLPAMTEGRGIFGTSAGVQVQSIARGNSRYGIKPDLDHDLLVALANLRIAGTPGQPPPPKPIPTSSMHLVVIPLAFFVALLMATPMTNKRRALSLLLGGSLCILFSLSRFAILILAGFHGDGPHSLYHAGPFWTYILGRLLGFATEVMATSYLVPLIIWLAVAFRRTDVDRLLAWATIRSTPRSK